MEGFIIIFIFHPLRWCFFFFFFHLFLTHSFTRSQHSTPAMMKWKKEEGKFFQLSKNIFLRLQMFVFSFVKWGTRSWKHQKKIFAQRKYFPQNLPEKAGAWFWMSSQWWLTVNFIRFFAFFLTFCYWTDLKYLHIFLLIASKHYSLSLHSQCRLDKLPFVCESIEYVTLPPPDVYVSAFSLSAVFCQYLNLFLYFFFLLPSVSSSQIDCGLYWDGNGKNWQV